MNRKSILLLGALLGFLLASLLRRRRKAEVPVDPRAEELRRTLDEARLASPTVPRAREESSEQLGREPTAGDDLELERRRVHERARRAANEMRGEEPSSSP